MSRAPRLHRNVSLNAATLHSKGMTLQPQPPAHGKFSRPWKKQRTSKTLLIDNYDSYTYNLYQLISKVSGETPEVIQNDELSWRILAKRLSQGQYRDVIISPGPGTPLQPLDIGVCRDLFENAERTPVLGVCLGMQALAYVHGANVIQAPEPIHGRLSEIRHNSNPLFHGIPSGCSRGFEVVRYHSLAVTEESLPACLEPIAWTCGQHHSVNLRNQPRKDILNGHVQTQEGENLVQGGVLMGIAHRSQPHWGVQFHPESVATAHGETLMRNFFAESEASTAGRDLPDINGAASPFTLGSTRLKVRKEVEEEEKSVSREEAGHDNLDVRWRAYRGVLNEFGGSEAIFWHLFAHIAAADTFWLDSASKDGQRFSYMGGKGGPLWKRLIFNLSDPSSSSQSLQPGTLSISSACGDEQTMGTHFLDHLEAQLEQWHVAAKPGELPFDFTGGFVGYMGYEMKAECGAANSHASPDPDAAMFFTDRLVVTDHVTGDVYLVALHEQTEPACDLAEAWLEETAGSLDQLREQVLGSAMEFAPKVPSSSVNLHANQHIDNAPGPQEAGWAFIESPAGDLESRKSREAYLADVALCLDSLNKGDSYELCLTTQLRKRVSVCPKELYSHLRASNPAAHAAWLSLGAGLPTICCSSPERFLKGYADGMVEARPIKGTARRHSDPELDAESRATLVESAKARAENLMIVDLLRNDLGRVCEVGSVHVPGLMEVESYSTVHNLVSTVRGQRKRGSTVIDCLRACFPGGSMTGAPKLRSMNILDRLENGPRGVYSGCLGFIGLNNTFDLNIVIRTAVVSDSEVTVGAGGAIVLQSDPQDEYEEMLLKANALMKAIDICHTKA